MPYNPACIPPECHIHSCRRRLDGKNQLMSHSEITCFGSPNLVRRRTTLSPLRVLKPSPEAISNAVKDTVVSEDLWNCIATEKFAEIVGRESSRKLSRGSTRSRSRFS